MISVDAESLCITIVETLKEIGLNRCVVVAQCYDGASVMSGTISGVQARVRQIHSCAVYIHCHSHRLNLVIVDVCRDVKSAGEFFALVELLYVFITRQKVHEIFIRLQKERDLSIRELGRLSDTRWACRYRNIAVIIERFDVIIDVLCESQELNDSEIRVQANGILEQLRNYRFVTNLVIFNRILTLSHGVSEALQSSTINIAECSVLIATLQSTLADLRDNLWTEVWQDINAICSTNDIAIEPCTQTTRKRKCTVKENPDFVT
jgi:hypothetical protein